MLPYSHLSANLLTLQERIQKACESANRPSSEITLIWVSKNHPRIAVDCAFAQGAIHFGENRVQEAMDKFQSPPTGIELHLIGPIQGNKLRKAAGIAQWIHSMDRIDHLIKLNEIAAENGKFINVLLQINTSAEDSKSGIDQREARNFLHNLPGLDHLRYQGLMTMGPNSGNPEDAQRGFAFLSELRTEFHQSAPHFQYFQHLSMGMSGDLEIAIAKGATMIRIGTALFGSR